MRGPLVEIGLCRGLSRCAPSAVVDLPAVPVLRPVTDRQLDVLHWIAAGCPERSWPDDTHKHSARALQNRGLAHVARRQGVWVAEITDVGRHYIEHGNYPPSTKEVGPAQSVRRTAPPRPRRPVAPRVSPALAVELGPATPTDAQRLLVRLLRAGGRLEVDLYADRAAADELKKAPYLPAGQVLKARGRGWHQRLLYLTEDPRAAVPERVVTVPARLTKPHPIARSYRDDQDRHEVSARQLARTTRIVHALATAFDELGYEFRSGHRTPDGQFMVGSDRGGIPIRISEKSAPGGAHILHYNLRRGRPLPAWQARRQKEFIATGQLTILVGGQYGGREGRQCRFSDTKSHQLEDLLPAVVREIEMRVFERLQDRLEAEREDREREAQWQEILAAAAHRATEAFRADVLAQRAKAWRRWQEQAAYLDGLSGRLQELPDAEQRLAEEWLAWARPHLAATDPTLVRHAMPSTPRLTREFLEPHIRGWAGAYRSFGE